MQYAPVVAVDGITWMVLPGLAFSARAEPVVGVTTPALFQVSAGIAADGLSVAQLSTFVAAFFRSALREASTPFLRWLRNTGMAMAARMPMMMMTTRSSIRVKPWSFSFMDF